MGQEEPSPQTWKFWSSSRHPHTHPQNVLVQAARITDLDILQAWDSGLDILPKKNHKQRRREANMYSASQDTPGNTVKGISKRASWIEAVAIASRVLRPSSDKPSSESLSFPAQSGWSPPFSLRKHFPEALWCCLKVIFHRILYLSFCNSYSRHASLSCQHLSSESGLPHANRAWRASLFSLTMWLIAGIKTGGLGLLPWETCSLLLAATVTKCFCNVFWLEALVMTQWWIFVLCSGEISLHFLHGFRNGLQCPVSCEVLFGLVQLLRGDFLCCPLSESTLSATSPECDARTNNTSTVTKGHKHVNHNKIAFPGGTLRVCV